MSPRRGSMVKVDQTKELEEAVVLYSVKKDEASAVKKIVDTCNQKIKELMSSMKLTEFVVGSIKATITTADKSSFNDLRAIEILRESLDPEMFKQVVKTREYFDDDAFEKMVYNHQIDANLLAPCVEKLAPVTTLRIGKAK